MLYIAITTGDMCVSQNELCKNYIDVSSMYRYIYINRYVCI